MATTKILLGESKHRLSANEENNIGVELQAYEKVLPYTESAYGVDAYLRYFKEKDESNKYRLAFTITPFCSNVLFNMLTEPVYKEGSPDCMAVTDDTSISGFERYKAISHSGRTDLVRDTGFSHPKTNTNGYPIVYHCGYDIFNNHFFRKKEFNVVNKSSGAIQPCFNTIKDLLRDNSGMPVEEKILHIDAIGRLNNSGTPIHLYQYDTISSYPDAIINNLSERDGWFGFYNPTTIAIDNVTTNNGTFSINKCMNGDNDKPWDYIDMYPGRNLYSFVPNMNSFEGRAERNWDYCVTFPYASDEDHEMVSFTEGELKVNGLRCKMDTHIGTKNLEMESALVTFKSFTKHNLSADGYVTLSFIENGPNERKTANPVKIVSLGKNGLDSEHYFSVRLSSILNEVADISGTKVTVLKNNGDFKEIRFRKYDSGCEAKYYLRRFRPFPNPMENGKTVQYRNSLNKLSFSQNIYSDQVAQIVYTSDFDTTGLHDNLGRPLSELYLTIVKRNVGYKAWYEENKYAEDDTTPIEFSHCFGEVTSGFNLPPDDECRDFNVRRIHSIDNTLADKRGITISPKKLETDITIDKIDFYGDLAEFLPSKMTEETVEDVYHRFNTAQRETSNPKYSVLLFDEIAHDDYDINEDFTAETRSLISREKRVNLVPEGYYYKPHYKVLVREFEPTVNQGNHILVNCTSIKKGSNPGEWKLQTASNYYFETIERVDNEDPGSKVMRYPSKVYVRKFYNGKFSEITGLCSGVTGDHFTDVTIVLGKLNDDETDVITPDTTDIRGAGYKIYRENTEMPDGAYPLEDGSGRYLWRNVLSYSDMTPDDLLYDDVFTNGAHYFHKNIMFYLRRQDPDGEYGIGDEPGDLPIPVSMEGRAKDVAYAEYVEEGKGSVC